MIYPGVYHEYCNILGKKYITLIGVDRKRCILRYDDANYLHAPLRISGNCYVKDLTVISTAKDYISDVDESTGYEAWKRDVLDGHYSAGHPTWLGTMGAYAIHCDDDHNDDGELVVSTFENCDMYSETFPALGAGLWPNQKIELIRCNMSMKIDIEVYKKVYPSARGTIYVHGLQSVANHGEYGEHLYMHSNCVSTNYGHAAYFEKVHSETEDLDYLFYYNIFTSDNLDNMELIKMIGVNVNDNSFGNNTSFLNGIVE